MKAYSELSVLGRTATDEEMAENWNYRRISNSKYKYLFNSFSDDLLEQKGSVSSTEAKQEDIPEDGRECEAKILLHINIYGEKIVDIILKELTHKEIGKLLNISESRVSQLHTNSQVEK